MKKTCLAIVLAFSLIGCDAVQRGEIRPGATKDQVQQYMGQPETVWRQPDGREFWDYPRGPEGTETIRMTIGSDGVMKDQLNILTESNFGQIQNGMNKEQVRQLIGRPGYQRKYGTKPGDTWEWRYMASPTQQMIFQVDFDGNGAVAGKGSMDPQLNKPQ